MSATDWHQSLDGKTPDAIYFAAREDRGMMPRYPPRDPPTV
jgi:hypothetical protein